MYSQFQAAEPPPHWFVGNVPGSQKILGMWDKGLQQDIDTTELFQTPLKHWEYDDLIHCSLDKLIQIFGFLCDREYDIFVKMSNLALLSEASLDIVEKMSTERQVERANRLRQLLQGLTTKMLSTTNDNMPGTNDKIPGIWIDNGIIYDFVTVIIEIGLPNVFEGFTFAERNSSFYTMEINRFNYRINQQLIRHGAIVNVDGENITYNGHTKAISINCSQFNVPTCIEKIQSYWNFWGCSSLDITSLENNQVVFDDNDLGSLLNKLRYDGLPSDETPPCMIKIENTLITWQGVCLLIDWVTSSPDRTRVALDITLQNGISMTLNLPQ